MKSREEIMNMLEAFDLTESSRDAGELAGCSHHTVAAYVARRDEGRLGGAGPVRRERIIDPWMAKIEEWGGALLWQDPRRSLLRQAEGVGVRGFGPHGAPSSGGVQEQLRGGSAAGVSAVDP